MHVYDDSPDVPFETLEEASAAEDYTAVRVHVTNPVATTTAATEFGSYETVVIPASLANQPQYAQVLPHDPYRQYAYITAVDCPLILTTELTQAQALANAAPLFSGSSQTELLPSSPAAATDFTYTNNSGSPQSLQALRWTFTSDATVGNRSLSVQIKDAAGNVLGQAANLTSVTATSTLITALAVGMSNIWNNASGTSTGALPAVNIPVNGTVVIHISGTVGAADQISGVSMVFNTPATSGPLFPNGYYLPQGMTCPAIRHNDPVYVVNTSASVCRVAFMVERGKVDGA